MSAELRFEKVIQASPEAVFRAFTNTVAFTEWLCDRALVVARLGGQFFVAWNQGYYAAGAYSEVTPHSAVGFSWLGRDDPGMTQVKITVSPEGAMTKLVLVQSGFGDGEAWERARGEIQKGWETGLENLAAVMEKGPDLRIANRPMMGLLFGGFDQATAERLGVPVSEGMRLDGTIEGMGAQKAGLQKDDVVVEFNGLRVKTFNEIGQGLQGKKAGDRVEVGFYRGAEKHSVTMELSFRPLPEMPSDAADFAARVEQIYQDDECMLRQALEGVTDAEAAKRPAENEWSVNEVLSHLVQNERMVHMMVMGAIFSVEPFGEGFADNFHPWVRATAEVYGSPEQLMDELCRNQAETVGMLRGLPEGFVTRKSSFWRLAYNLLSFPYHAREHGEQIQLAVAAARK